MTHIFEPVHVHTNHCWWDHREAHWVCAFGAASARPDDNRSDSNHPETAGMDTAGPESPLVDLRDMLVVHAALRREFRLAPAAVERVAPGDRKAAAAVERHLQFLCDMLHHHHAGEDELLWPLLQERLTETGRRLVDEVEAQHVGVDACLAVVTAAREAWTSAPDLDRRDVLAAGLRRLHALLSTHLDCEEATVLPLAATVLTQAEWNSVGEAAAAAMPKPDLVLAIGMFAYEGDPVVLRGMLASAPFVPRMLVPRIGPLVYARRARRVHGTDRP